MQQLVDVALSFEALVAVVSVVLSALALVLGKGVVRRRRVALATYHAFHIVEDVAAECRAAGKAFPYLDKASAGLSYANEWMRANGWRELKPGEEVRAQLGFKVLHGEVKASSGPVRPALLALALLAPLALQAGCAAFRPQPLSPPTPGACQAWRAAELAWAMADEYMRQVMKAQQGQACLLPAPAPVPAAPPPAQ
jgi:hypothetical protein